jgi:hypothetical protein
MVSRREGEKVKTKNKCPQPVPHHVLLQQTDQFCHERNVTQVLLEPARGPVGQGRLRVSKGLWDLLLKVAEKHGYLGLADNHRRALTVDQGVRFAAALRAGLGAVPEKDRATVEGLVTMLYKLNGLHTTFIFEQEGAR